jgi:hypothetical protein
MRKIGTKRSIVAIDPTTRGMAYVFFERGELIDAGHQLADKNEQDGLAVLDRLIDGCAADVLVFEDPDAEDCHLGARLRTLLRSVERHARRRGIRTVKVSRKEVRETWVRRGFRVKEQVARALVSDFPELERYAAAERKVGRSETMRVNVFDALTLLLHAFGPPSSADDLAA